MLQVFVILCALSAALAAEGININQRVDDTLPQINQHMLKEGLQKVTLPDLFVQSAPVFIGVQVQDLTTMKRNGDAEMWQTGDDSVFAHVPLTLGQMTLSVDFCPLMNASLSATVGSVSFDVGFELKSQPKVDCATEWKYFNLTKLEDVLVHTSNPKYDGKPPPPEVMQIIVPHYNKWLNTPDCLALAAKYLNLCDPTSNVHV